MARDVERARAHRWGTLTRMATQTLRRARRHEVRAAALTASGARVTSGTPRGEKLDADDVRRLRKPWQQRSFDYYDIVPEVWYASQFYSRHMSKVELRVEQYDREKAEWTPAPGTPAQELLDRMHDQSGGRGDLIGAYGRLRFLVGECYLVCFDPELPTERWEVLSLSELLPNDNGKGYKRIKAEGFQVEELTEAPDDNEYEQLEKTARVWRLWRRHPRYSMAADSPMRAVQDVCEELCLLTLAVRAQARSRIAKSGILLIPSEISPPPPEPLPDQAPEEDVFLRNLTLHMEAPLADEGSPAQLVPLLVRGPAAYLKELRQLQISVEGAGNYPEAALRTEAISRLANGLDMPREALLGTADVNHWGAWQIDQQTFVAHVQPVIEEMCNELTAAVLRPALEEGGAAKEELGLWRVWYDAVKITNHPDRGKDAKDLFDNGELGGHAYREAKGFDENDAPTDEERARFVGIKVRDGVLATTGKPALRAGATEVNVPPGSPGDPTQTPPQDGGTGNDVSPGAPVVDDAARLLGAADIALWTCRRTAGSRLVAKAPRKPSLAQIPKTQIYAHLGADGARSLNGDTRLGDPEWLVQGGTEAFEMAMEAWGYPPDRVTLLGKMISAHAAATLHQEQPDALPLEILNV